MNGRQGCKGDEEGPHVVSLRLRWRRSEWQTHNRNDNEMRIYSTFVDMSKRFDAFQEGGALVRQRTSLRAAAPGAYSRTIITSVDFTSAATVWPFFKRGCPNRVRGVDGGNPLSADRERHLRHQAVDLDVRHAAHQLVASADAAEVAAAFGSVSVFAVRDKGTGPLPFRNAMMATRRLHRAEFTL